MILNQLKNIKIQQSLCFILRTSFMQVLNNANIQLYKGLINMEIRNHSIKSTHIQPQRNSIFMHKNTFYGKSIHLRRGIRRIPAQNTLTTNKIKMQDSNNKIITDSCKSLSISRHFKQIKSQKLEVNQLERNSKTVNLNITNADLNDKFIGDCIKKNKYVPKKKITIVNGHQIWVKHNQAKKTKCNQAQSAKQPLSAAQLIFTKINANTKNKQRSIGIKERSKTLPNNFENRRQIKQVSLKTTTIQSLGNEFQTQFLFPEYQYNQDLIVKIPSPHQSDVYLQQRYKQKPSRDIKVLILQKTNQSTNFRIKQQKLINYSKQQKPKKSIEESAIKVDIDNQFGPWLKKIRANEEHEEIF